MKKENSVPNFINNEHSVLKFWQDNNIQNKYLNKNNNSNKYYKFLDGPMTANAGRSSSCLESNFKRCFFKI